MKRIASTTLLASIVFLLALAACGPAETQMALLTTTTPTTNVTVTLPATLTPSPAAALTVTPTPTPVPTPTPAGLYNVPDGEYIIYYAEENNEDYRIFLISPVGGFLKNLLFQKNLVSIRSSLDNPKWLFIDTLADEKMINLETMEEKTLTFSNEFDSNCLPFDEYDIFTDDQTLVAACHPSSDDTSTEIYSFSGGEEGIRLTDCISQGGDCSAPFFSPDGKWLSYLWRSDFSPASQFKKYQGFYIAPSECIHYPEGCQPVAIGPLTPMPNAYWLGNSSYLVMMGMDQTFMYDVYEFDSGKMRTVQIFDKTFEAIKNQFGDDFPMTTPLLSEDGTRIAFTYGGKIHLIEISNGNVTTLPVSDSDLLLAWVKIEGGKIIH